MIIGALSKFFIVNSLFHLKMTAVLTVPILYCLIGTVIIPGIYGMHKLVRWVLKHRALRRRYKGGRMSQDLIEEAEEELD